VEEADDQVANHERPEEAASKQQQHWSTPGGRLSQHDQQPEAAAGEQGEGGAAPRSPVTPDFPKKTKCIPICMPGSSFMHIVT
jgi:hypothetical protein